MASGLAGVRRGVHPRRHGDHDAATFLFALRVRHRARGLCFRVSAGFRRAAASTLVQCSHTKIESGAAARGAGHSGAAGPLAALLS